MSERRRLRAELHRAGTEPAGAMPARLARFDLRDWYDPADTPGPADTAPATQPATTPSGDVEAMFVWRAARAWRRWHTARAAYGTR